MKEKCGDRFVEILFSFQSDISGGKLRDLE
jgi:hypothetical protein